MRAPSRGGRGGGFGGRDGGRGRGGFGGRGGGGGRGWQDQGPPESVVEAGTFSHPCEGEAVCKLTNEKVGRVRREGSGGSSSRGQQRKQQHLQQHVQQQQQQQQ